MVAGGQCEDIEPNPNVSGFMIGYPEMEDDE